MKIGIIGAMEQEVTILRDTMQSPKTLQKGGFTFYTGQLGGHEVTLVQSGIGKVAATVATTLLIDNFAPDCVINTGSAGGFEPSLNVGDIVISDEVRHHDVDVTAFGYEIGQVPQMPAGFAAHPALIEASKESIHAVDGIQTMVGQICTGDSFMCDPVRIENTRQAFPNMLAVEMEGAAIAQACHVLNTPFVVIRSMSDIAGKESPQSFEEYLEVASVNSSKLVVALLEKLQQVSL
ncbi:5'-methylthioadenosine/S-adenosylhomocysteine nucleosidase [Pseudoalteromonas luteoviolacea]|uniref:5'-methylthioadenosine/S-adenosylhomocysteine nucleosidase n=1 Tax=Pseudoalteromonas luteoviolacea DSM 6061 TaxID=1365250 RepID=A0A167CEF3_9GAMM|nr:5'-methylthioadenosine/S-adenosylhomocysteine nucleosidase [Pseudoalteromonas luteoviolacea]KZN47566.1 5'-methylthioadenosine/S-adenosylhomocysteine nucleosidase [Pseudoalteromonas luteoviolacea DSM 6061]KZN56134.1 5'-methylthioadenosine/S-adenosylhomocysteine nucleosidase [Pseudoalteromonas luteoviolacea CPMOR-2]MBE0388536.1 adenosylhomocysteine nucleosidase [Pseudoalteromonas luteoviolacea DSM 6061]TQF66737.1 5'-methylthioadenosine/S-adenosylhomocysteine nucleosidase [Pseudoalteromonas lut